MKDKDTNKKGKKDKKEVLKSKIELTDEEIIAMNKKVSEAEEKALRAQAELINYRKRKDEELEKKLKFANLDLIVEMLTILDNFQRAIQTKTSDEKLLDGIKMVYSNMTSTLEKYGLKKIDALGKKFDANFHEAVMSDCIKDKEDDIIIEVLQDGYTLKDKVIRPVMVKVNKL